MARYNRINLDGVSDTKAGVVTAETLPGTFLSFDSGTDKFIKAGAVTALGKYYLANRSQLSVNVDDAIAADDYVSAEVLSSNRELAGLLADGQTILEDDPLTLSAGGLLIKAVDPALAIGWANEALTTSGSDELIKFVAA